MIEMVRAAFRALPDGRGPSNNRRYAMEDAALSAFAVFFSQSPSFLDSQVRMQKQQGKNNASSLFGVHEIPCDNQIRNLLDPVPAATLFPVIAEIGDTLYHQGYLEAFRS
ncbi:MAG: ISNCY family transposase, partial [Betaproteobacteria bacterium]|nr:ISNCY family transposase [Betaproteobacteria bacterium]